MPITLYVLHLSVSEVVRASNEQFQLISDLFDPSRYNDIVRPVMNESDSVLVSVEVTLDQISDVVSHKTKLLSITLCSLQV